MSIEIKNEIIAGGDFVKKNFDYNKQDTTQPSQWWFQEAEEGLVLFIVFYQTTRGHLHDSKNYQAKPQDIELCFQPKKIDHYNEYCSNQQPEYTSSCELFSW